MAVFKKKIALQKQPIFLLNGEVIWQASDSPLSKELHVHGNAWICTKTQLYSSFQAKTL